MQVQTNVVITPCTLQVDIYLHEGLEFPNTQKNIHVVHIVFCEISKT